MTLRAASLFLCLAAMLAFPKAAQAIDGRGSQPNTAATLQSLADNPAYPVNSLLVTATPSPSDAGLFDRAFEAVRNALRGNPNDGNLHSNLGVLYLCRNSFHRDESGNFQRAVDQFLVALRYDPSNVAALTDLGTYEVFNRIPSELPADGGARIEAAIRRGLDRSPSGPIALRTLAVLLRFDGHATEAFADAKLLDGVRPNEAATKVLVGAMALAAAAPTEARAAFDAALQLSPSPLQAAVAKLGSAQAALALGDLDTPDRLLQSSSEQSDPALESAARELGLSTPAELGWRLAKAFSAKGRPERGIWYMQPDDLVYLSAAAAEKKNNEGHASYKADDLEGARLAFLAATELDPEQAVYWHNAANVSFQLGRYQDAVVAYEKAATLGPAWPLDLFVFDHNEDYGYAMSYAVLGDYQKARGIFEGGAKDFPTQDYLGSWAVDTAYGAGGWDEALRTWSRVHGSEPSREDRFEMWIHIRDGLWNIAQRAEKRGSLYLSLRHETLMYRADGEALQRDLLSTSGRQMIIKERAQELSKIVNAYSRIPIKPALGSDVQGIIEQAKPLLGAAFTGDTQWKPWARAMGLYQQAIERAPWWPQGHYMLALLACRIPDMNVHIEDIGRDEPVSGGHSISGRALASREIATYLALAPGRSAADEARDAMKGCVTQ